LAKIVWVADLMFLNGVAGDFDPANEQEKRSRSGEPTRQDIQNVNGTSQACMFGGRKDLRA
jgi:hypothetical protein